MAGIGRGLVAQRGNWSTGRTRVSREERDLRMDAPVLQYQCYSTDTTGVDQG